MVLIIVVRPVIFFIDQWRASKIIIISVYLSNQSRPSSAQERGGGRLIRMQNERGVAKQKNGEQDHTIA